VVSSPTVCGASAPSGAALPATWNSPCRALEYPSALRDQSNSRATLLTVHYVLHRSGRRGTCFQLPTGEILTSPRQESRSFLFHSLEYPPEAMVAQTLEKISAIKQRQIETNAHISEQKRKFEYAIDMTTHDRALITQLELLRSDLDDDLVELQSVLGPWRPSRIPLEVLCKIFVYASGSSFVSFLWNLMAVCRAWRRAAIGCSALWSTLYIVHHEPSINTTNDRCWRVNYKSKALPTPVAVRKAIRRSRGGLLHVDVFIGKDTNAGFCRDCFMRCLDMIGRRRERLRSFGFNIQNSDLGVSVGPMLAGSLSNLRLVRISSDSSDLIAALASHAPSLHTIEFTGLALQHFTPYIGKALWPRIRKLNLGYTWNRQLHNLSRLLATCTALHSLWLSDGRGCMPWPTSIPKSWPSDMPTLTSMRCILRLSAWTLLSGMRITVLYIRNPMTGTYDTRGMSRIHLPKLEHLTCVGPTTTLCAAELFDVPSIANLVIMELYADSLGASRDLKEIWRNMSIRPRNVVLHWRSSPTNSDLEYDLRYFLPLLDCLRDIQCLTLRGVPLSHAEVFTQPRTQKFCPNLDRITWWLISDTDDAGSRNRFYEAASGCFGRPETHWMVERISLAEDNRTFFDVRTLLPHKLDWN